MSIFIMSTSYCLTPLQIEHLVGRAQGSKVKNELVKRGRNRVHVVHEIFRQKAAALATAAAVSRRVDKARAAMILIDPFRPPPPSITGKKVTFFLLGRYRTRHEMGLDMNEINCLPLAKTSICPNSRAALCQ